MFRKGDQVVKILSGAGVETASIQVIHHVKKGHVFISDDDSMPYHKDTGRQVEHVIPGFSSRLIILES